jgi:hypothetical protein
LIPYKLIANQVVDLPKDSDRCAQQIYILTQKMTNYGSYLNKILQEKSFEESEKVVEKIETKEISDLRNGEHYSQKCD